MTERLRLIKTIERQRKALKAVLPYIKHPDVQSIPFALPVQNIERMIVEVLNAPRS